jgi:hypothetical protein
MWDTRNPRRTSLRATLRAPCPGCPSSSRSIASRHASEITEPTIAPASLSSDSVTPTHAHAREDGCNGLATRERNNSDNRSRSGLLCLKMAKAKPRQQARAHRLIVAGYSNAEIARVLKVDRSTVLRWRRAGGFPPPSRASKVTLSSPPSQFPRAGRSRARAPLLPTGSPAAIVGNAIGAIAAARRSRRSSVSSPSPPAQRTTVVPTADGPLALPGELEAPVLPPMRVERPTVWTFDRDGRPRVTA